MATGTICSTFDITLLSGNAEGVASDLPWSFTTSRAFTVVGATVYHNTAAATDCTITRVVTTNGVPAAGVVMTADNAAPPVAGAAVVAAIVDTPSPSCAIAILPSAASCPAPSAAVSTVVTVSSAGALLVKVVLHCIGNPSQAFPVT